MSLFDWYIPQPPLHCPFCKAPLDGWQGKDGPCLLFVWCQGQPAPIEQRTDDDWKVLPSELESFRLPEHLQFMIHTDCNCNYRFLIDAICNTQNSIWTHTRLLTEDDIDQIYLTEPKSKRTARKLEMRKQID